MLFNEVLKMSDKCKKDDWVEIHYVVLEACERTGDIPEDTRKVPLECWIKGWAEKEGTAVSYTHLKDAITLTSTGVREVLPTRRITFSSKTLSNFA